MNLETWAYLRHLYLVEKLPKKIIARKLNLTPKTVRRALKKETFTPPAKVRLSKLDDFKTKIDALQKAYPGISAIRIQEEIKKSGYSGSISILRDYLKMLRPKSRSFLIIQTAPGEEAQVDWAYAGTLDNKQKIYCFVMVLSFSGLLYLEFFPSQSLENFMSGHLSAFHFFRGIPKKIRYDNLKSVVLSRFGSAIQFNPRFIDFARHYLFDPSVCSPKSPHEKGRVERAIHYIKGNLLAGRSFGSLTDINQNARLWLDQVANGRIHGTSKKKPIDLFSGQEQSLLIPLPQQDYDTRLLLAVKSTSQSLVTLETNRYSVPHPYASRMLTLKANVQEVFIYDQDQLIARHKRSFQKYQLIKDRKHYQGLLATRPKAHYFKHRDLLLALGTSAQAYLKALTQTELNLPHQLKKIVTLIDLFGKNEVLAAMEQALPFNALGHDYLKNIILTQRRKKAWPAGSGSPTSKINPELVRSTFVEERDLLIYDQHFNPREDAHEASKS